MKLALDVASAIAQPIGLVWALLLAAGLRLLFKRRCRTALLPLALAAILHAVGATPLPAWLLARLERPYDPLIHPWAAHADAVVMLGGTHDYSPRSPLGFGVGEASDRILLAVELVRQGRAPVLVLGGSYYEVRGVRRPDSELLLHWFQSWRLPVGEVVSLGDCSDTHVEAMRVARLARERGWHSVLLVTSAYHLSRATALFKRAGVAASPCGAEYLGLDSLGAGMWRAAPTVRGFDLMRYWTHEQLGWLYYRARGWL